MLSKRKEFCLHGHPRTKKNIRYEQGNAVCKECRQGQYQRLKGKIMKPTIPFDVLDEDHAKKVITPLGAAIVEALPDREKVNRIKARFRRGICPPSALFLASQVVEFYKNCGVKIVAEPPAIRGKQ